MMKDLMSGSYLFGGNAAYIDELYEAYLQGDETISPEWKRYFDQIQVLPGPRDVPHEPVRELIARIARERGAGRPQIAPAELAQLGRKQAAVFQLISSYRFLGVRHASLDPLKRLEKPHVPELEPAFHDLGEDDLERVEVRRGVLDANGHAGKEQRRQHDPERLHAIDLRPPRPRASGIRRESPRNWLRQAAGDAPLGG